MKRNVEKIFVAEQKKVKRNNHSDNKIRQNQNKTKQKEDLFLGGVSSSQKMKVSTLTGKAWLACAPAESSAPGKY
jgi:phosphoribosylamine-glycine ligase